MHKSRRDPCLPHCSLCESAARRQHKHKRISRTSRDSSLLCQLHADKTNTPVPHAQVGTAVAIAQLALSAARRQDKHTRASRAGRDSSGDRTACCVSCTPTRQTHPCLMRRSRQQWRSHSLLCQLHADKTNTPVPHAQVATAVAIAQLAVSAARRQDKHTRASCAGRDSSGDRTACCVSCTPTRQTHPCLMRKSRQQWRSHSLLCQLHADKTNTLVPHAQVATAVAIAQLAVSAARRQYKHTRASCADRDSSGDRTACCVSCTLTRQTHSCLMRRSGQQW